MLVTGGGRGIGAATCRLAAGQGYTVCVNYNVFGAMLCAREAVKRMSTRNGGKGGAIVNVSTGFVKSGGPGMFLDYAASKGAIEVMTAGLAREVATEGIRVNAVRPGMIDTEIHADGGDAERLKKAKHIVPMQRHGEAEEVARAILWLASDAASYITGTIVDVSGGI